VRAKKVLIHFSFPENSPILHKPPCILDSQLPAGKVGPKARQLPIYYTQNKRGFSFFFNFQQLLEGNKIKRKTV